MGTDTEVEEKSEQKGGPKGPQGPKFVVVIEGREYEWHKDTITTEEIASLGGWDPAQGVIEIDRDNVERTLKPGEIIDLKPGHGFSKKIRWKRGDTAVTTRIAEELALLRSRFPDMEYHEVGQWVLIHNFPLPADWGKDVTDIAFQIPTAYPATPPYGFCVPSGLRYKGAMPNNYQDESANQPPFGGKWGFFSWAHDAQWRPTTDLVTGCNLLNVVMTFNDRLREGA